MVVRGVWWVAIDGSGEIVGPIHPTEHAARAYASRPFGGWPVKFDVVKVTSIEIEYQEHGATNEVLE